MAVDQCILVKPLSVFVAKDEIEGQVVGCSAGLLIVQIVQCKA